MSDTQLLILGNGFDLQCELESTFDDFEKKRINEIKKMGRSIRDGHLPAKIETVGPDKSRIAGNSPTYWFWDRGFTLWDIILYEDQRKRTWYDIEECIRSWVVDRIRPDGTIAAPGEGSTDLNLENHDPLPFWDADIVGAVKSYASDLYKWDGTSKRILSILMNELHRYEGAFAMYLEEQTQGNTNYSFRANQMIINLVFDQLSKGLSKEEKDSIWGHSTNILDFNYTMPLKQFKPHPFVFNVHGKAASRNIIFGIDGTGVDTGVELYPEIVKFTKTFRLMALSSDRHRPLVQPYIPGTGQQETQYIKFFGHSLGEADYSYFQAIFDEVDLYESQTHLIFYYNARRRNGDRADEEMFEKVNHLISRYGETLDNMDHGKNLLHKLLLEGRLSVIQAPL